MTGLFAGGVLAVLAVVFFGVVMGLISLVFSLILLPFKLLGFVFRSIASLLLLPLLIIPAIVVAIAFGLGFFALVVPALPIILIALAVWWLMRRRDRPAPRTT